MWGTTAAGGTTSASVSASRKSVLESSAKSGNERRSKQTICSRAFPEVSPASLYLQKARVSDGISIIRKPA
jgi:hypothetical protein